MCKKSQKAQLKASTGKHTSGSEGKEALADYMGWKALNHPMRPSKNLGESRKDEKCEPLRAPMKRRKAIGEKIVDGCWMRWI